MHLDHVMGQILRRLLLWTLLGVAGVVIASVLLSLFWALLTVALVGFVLWLPLHSALVGHRKELRKCWKAARHWGRTTGERGQAALDEFLIQCTRQHARLRDSLYKSLRQTACLA